MGSRTRAARILVTISAAFLAVVPPLADLNATHVLNPGWPGHARLHTVWLISTNSLLSLLALWWLWRARVAGTREAVLGAAAIVGAILAGFFIAGATRAFYAGTFADADGIPITAGPIDANVAAFSVLLCLVIAAVVLVRGEEA